MYTTGDINKIITDKNGDKVRIVPDDGDRCEDCFYNVGNSDSCNPVRDENARIGCWKYEFKFVKVEL